LTRTQLELGGKNALIVMDDADLSRALDAAVVAGFSNAGQWCTSTSRVLLQRGIATPFLQALASRADAMIVGDGVNESTDMGPVAGAKQYADVSSAIRLAVDEGARVAAGGVSAQTPSGGYFLRPTVLTHVTPTMHSFREEIFGPVLAVCEFDTLDQAL